MKHLLLLTALLLAGCATSQTSTPAAAPQSAQEALRPYYATLDAKLPKAPANPALSADTVLTRINRRARIVICGAISQYNNTTPVKGPSNYLSLLVNRARMEGIVVFDWADRYGEGIKQISQWMKEGKFISREDVVDGLNTFPETLNMLFEGKNFGKLVLKLADE